MPRTCTICRHADRRAIDEALGTPEPYRAIARRFSTSPSAIFRHWKKHWQSQHIEPGGQHGEKRHFD